MIKYYCQVCGNYLEPKLIDKNTNKCLVCKANLDKIYNKYGNSTKIEEKKILNDFRVRFNESYVKHEYKIFWSKTGNVPVFDDYCNVYSEKCTYISNDIRPVFPEEQLLLQILTGDEYKIINQSVWYTGGRNYFINGKKLKVSRSKMMLKDANELAIEYNRRKDEINYIQFEYIINKFVELNQDWFSYLKDEAISNIQKVAKDYEDDEMFISFSGGKDSTVVDDLVTKALLHRKVIKVFGDTTLEFPSTYKYVERIKADEYNRKYSKVLTAKNKHDDFYQLCDIVGPPSRVMRWCCTYFKTTPISDRIDRKFKNKKKLLTFYGIRRNESQSRSKYDMESDSPKISKQRVFAPIIDWFDFDVWLYIVSTGIDFNKAYRYGYSRVGCWNCPNNNDWAMFLSKIHMPELSKKWTDTLMDFAIKTNKEDPKGYVEDNYWKARQGGNGLAIADKAIVNFQPCVTEADTYNYHLSKIITEGLYQLFIPFGKVDFQIGNKRKGEVFILSSKGIPSIRLQGKIGTDLLKVTILDIKEMGGISRKIKNVEDAKRKIDCQITKYQTCVACSGCKSVCKFDAISVTNETVFNETTGNYDVVVDYKINENKCARCGECIDHYDSGCYMKKVLRTKKGK
ncbi:phosphoadenosine phosphosulfate reductase family protein [Vallitalea guaymasensis]|uniref:phosphoadenosine phosphosulfate reductase domain-containing protein n=1 Tax=Vallitalea guaymasensis TaxID=1185412 RepID=UPI000DE2E1F4|nr:phosphoadenosine phosphosulfate reductase family protein [Vallitalea guaymasensis]